MGLMMPYKLYEQYPELVKIERRLQVICYKFKCHPVFLPGYHDEKINHLNGASFDWKEVGCSMHMRYLATNNDRCCDQKLKK